MKKKHMPVVIFSSGIVMVVFLSTILGYSVYTQFKKDAFTSAYRDSIYKITADIFRGDLLFSNVSIKMSQEDAYCPVLEGNLLNTSARPLVPILIEISFSDIDGRILYKEWIRPLAGQGFDGMLFSADSFLDGQAISPGENLKFRHVMRNCPEHIVERTSFRRGFAKRKPSKELNFVYSVGALKIL